jgi:hypothetical protein
MTRPSQAAVMIPNAVGGVDGVPALLLHGTASESVEAILRDGFDSDGAGQN